MGKIEPTIDFRKIKSSLRRAPDKAAFNSLVVNEPFASWPVNMAELFLGFICYYLVDVPQNKLRLITASDTEHFRLAVQDYPPFDVHDFALPMSDTDNDIVRAVTQAQPVHTMDWDKVRRKPADAETVRLNQASSGIAMTYTYPLTGRQKGALMYNFFQYADAIGEPQLRFMERYTQLVSELLAT